MGQPRLMSFTEIQAALTCQARWDFMYGGRLAGSTLKTRTLAPLLSEGRAWGAGVAAWHAQSAGLRALYEGHAAITASFDEDEANMRKSGFPVLGRDEMEFKLHAILDHYASTTEPLPNLTKLEGEIQVPIPSRTGERSSSRYRFHGYIDGWTDDDGRPWIVEFKLRSGLTDPKLLERQRQPRWYAWGYEAQFNDRPLGVIVDERLNEAPRPARTVKGRKKDTPFAPSHAADQLTTPEQYMELCASFGVMPESSVLDALNARRWQQRFPLMFRDGEIEAAGRELVSAAKLLRDLDSGELEPVRNAQRATCSVCRFKDICSNPTDRAVVDVDFERGIPKRLRGDGVQRFAGEDSIGMRLALLAASNAKETQ